MGVLSRNLDQKIRLASTVVPHPYISLEDWEKKKQPVEDLVDRLRFEKWIHSLRYAHEGSLINYWKYLLQKYSR